MANSVKITKTAVKGYCLVSILKGLHYVLNTTVAPTCECFKDNNTELHSKLVRNTSTPVVFCFKYCIVTYCKR